MFEKPLASEEQLMLPLIRRSQKSTKLNLPEYFGKQLITQENINQTNILFGNKHCQINILGKNKNKPLNVSKKNPSNSKPTTGSSGSAKLQNSLSPENSLHSLYEPCVFQDKEHIMGTMQNELKVCQIRRDYPSKPACNKAIDGMLSKVPEKKHNSSQGNKTHVMKDKYISESADSIFINICQSKDQKSERNPSLLQLFPTDTLPKALSASSVFQPLHKRFSVSFLNSNVAHCNMGPKTTQASVKRSDKALKIHTKESKQNSANTTEKLSNHTLLDVSRYNKTNSKCIYVPQKLSNFDANCKTDIVEGISDEENNTPLAACCKESCRIWVSPVLSVSSRDIIQMYGSYFKELGIEPEGLAPINTICEKQHQK